MFDLKTKLYWLIQGSYKPAAFWEKWGNKFIDEPMQRAIYPQHEWILQVLLQEKPRTLLEVGCGFGRNIKFISERYPYQLIVTGTDFSKTMLEKAKEYLGINKSSSVSLQYADVLNLPFETGSFDAVLCHGVLMHIKPQDINKAITELQRVTKNILILVEQNDIIKPLLDKPYQKINYFTYAYPYKKLFMAHGAKIKKSHREGQLDWFLIYGIRKTK